MVSWDALRRTCPPGGGGESSSSALSRWGHIWSSVSSSELLSSGKIGISRSGLAEDYKGAWSISPMRKGWETWEDWEGISSALINIWRVEIKWLSQAVPSSA